MSTPMQTPPSARGELQSHFGTPPGSPDLAAECKRWENLCAELLAEREKLRAELALAERQVELNWEARFHEWAKDYEPDFTAEDVAEAMARIHEKPTLRDIIAELESVPEK